MRFQQIREMAKGMGINTYRMKKPDVIRAIQQAENSIDCYATPRIEYCNEMRCLWRGDCQTKKHGN